MVPLPGCFPIEGYGYRTKAERRRGCGRKMRRGVEIYLSLGCGVRNLRRVSTRPACNSSKDDRDAGLVSPPSTRSDFICFKGPPVLEVH